MLSQRFDYQDKSKGLEGPFVPFSPYNLLKQLTSKDNAHKITFYHVSVIQIAL
jgi:hypothetical protein